MIFFNPGHVAIEYEHNSLLLRWFNKLYEMSQVTNPSLDIQPLHPAVRHLSVLCSSSSVYI